MIYHCLPNHRGTELQNARDYFHSLVYDMEKQDNNESSPKLISVKKLTIETTVTERFALADFIRDFSGSNSRQFPKAKSDGFGNIPTQPPEA
jgi:predicted metal-dependent HD superfamily phosphohydrolase